ncbi:MAG: hypothetical protein R6U96_10285 [Promethearchaeia archaeon]
MTVSELTVYGFPPLTTEVLAITSNLFNCRVRMCPARSEMLYLCGYNSTYMSNNLSYFKFITY